MASIPSWQKEHSVGVPRNGQGRSASQLGRAGGHPDLGACLEKARKERRRILGIL